MLHRTIEVEEEEDRTANFSATSDSRMAGLQRFKLFAAAHCGLEAAPALSPRKSPVFHLRRRRTLRMLFDRNSEDRRLDLRQIIDESPESDRSSGNENKKENRARRKLKELLVTPEDREERCGGDREERREDYRPTASSVGEFIPRRTGPVRGFRYRILRKPWRPVLVSIPEH